MQMEGYEDRMITSGAKLMHWPHGLRCGPRAFVCWIVGLNPAWVMDVCPWFLYVVLSSIGRDLVMN
jgi:hypothetical protein